MLEEPIKLLRFLQSYADQQLADVSDEEFYKQPIPDMNHPAWGLGHVAFYLDRHAGFLGAATELDGWKEAFGQGTAATDGPEGYPPRDRIMAGWRAAGGRLIAAVEAATPEQLAAPSPVMPDEMPTLGDFLAFSMASHTAMHIGQIAVWRRALGRAPLF